MESLIKSTLGISIMINKVLCNKVKIKSYDEYMIKNCHTKFANLSFDLYNMIYCIQFSKTYTILK